MLRTSPLSAHSIISFQKCHMASFGQDSPSARLTLVPRSHIPPALGHCLDLHISWVLFSKCSMAVIVAILKPGVAGSSSEEMLISVLIIVSTEQKVYPFPFKIVVSGPALIKEAHNSTGGAGKLQEQQGQGVPLSVIIFLQTIASHACTTKSTVLFKNLSVVIQKTFVTEFKSRSKF